jgi:hypothetical protein
MDAGRHDAADNQKLQKTAASFFDFTLIPHREGSQCLITLGNSYRPDSTRRSDTLAGKDSGPRFPKRLDRPCFEVIQGGAV